MDGVARTLSSAYDAGGARVRLTHPDGTYVHSYRLASGALYYADLNDAVPLFYPPYDNIGRPTTLYRGHHSYGRRCWSGAYRLP